MAQNQKPKKKNLSLFDLDITKDTEIRFNDSFILPVKLKASELSYHDVNIATFNMMKYYEAEKYKKIIQNKNNPLTINKVDFNKDSIIYDASELTFNRELNESRMDDLIKLYLKHINTEDKLFEGKNLLEHYEVNDLFGWLMSIDFSNKDFNILQSHVSFWIRHVAKQLDDKISDLLELDDKKGKAYNQAMIELQIAYEYGKGVYFMENLNKTCSDWSYRERILSKAYFTKKYLIDKAVDDEMK